MNTSQPRISMEIKKTLPQAGFSLDLLFYFEP